MTLGLASVGVVVRDHTGWPAAAIAVTYDADAGLDPAWLAREIHPAAAELSRRIRGR